MKKLIALFIVLQFATNSFCVTKTAIASGNWSKSNNWSPAGAPTLNDDVIIKDGYTITTDSIISNCKTLSIRSSSTLKISNNSELNIHSITGITIDGNLEVTGSINILNPHTELNLNSEGKIIWAPQNNTEGNAQLFTQCDETLDQASTLVIQKWFNCTKGIGQYISGEIGNLTISGIWNWNMGESLRSHAITGKLALANSYIILDSSNTNCTLNVAQIYLQNSNSIVDVFKGNTGTKTINCNSISINSGQLNVSSEQSIAGVNLKCSGDITITSLGTLCGSYQNDANSTIEINGNLNLTKSFYYGIYQGAGNHTLSIAGNLTLLKAGTRFSEFHGIYNGNGNINVIINGDFNHQGFSDLILNDGITGVGNGNAKINIGGHFQQSSGDFRGVFNLTSYNAGEIEFNCKNLEYSGGIFMLYYACSNSIKNNKLNINGDLNVNFTNSTDIFRCNGLSNLNGTLSNAKLELNIAGNSKIDGNATAEFMTNTAYGNESINSIGTFKINGGNIKFNYSPHSITWIQKGDFEINGGSLQTSIETGNTDITFNGNFLLKNGNVSFKNKSGNTNIRILGNFEQIGGACKFYDNISQPLSHPITVNVSGDFIQEGGLIDFCNNSFSTANTTLEISGNNYRANAGEIKSSTTGTYYGKLAYRHAGIMNYFNNNAHTLINIKQSIEPNCNLSVNNYNFQISTGIAPDNDYLEIKNGATLNLNEAIINSSGNQLYSGIKLNENSLLKIGAETGLGALNFQSPIQPHYSIDKLSTIELNGSTSKITPLNNLSELVLGKLKINLNTEGFADLCTDLIIESELELTEGSIHLNKNRISIQNNTEQGIKKGNGFIVCNEKEGSIIRSNNLLINYEFPFGTNDGKYVPVFINCKSGTGKTIKVNSISTNKENLPLPAGLSANLLNSGNAISDQIDRWWQIDANGITGDITLTYASEENSTIESKRQENFSIKYKTATNWSEMIGNGTGIITNTGKVIAKNINPSGTFTIISNGQSHPSEIVQFEAIKNNKNCNLNWKTENENNCKEYIIERSNDNVNFAAINKTDAKNTIQNAYQVSDNNLLDGKYYYRIRIKSISGAEFFSETRIIEIGERVRNQENLTVKSVYPNPFSDKFIISYSINYDATSKFKLISMNGQTLFTSEKSDLAGDNSFEYTDELRLPPGYYLLNVISGTQKFTSKIYKNAY